MKKFKVYGYGNPGRQDDGLGVLLADKIADWAKENNYTNIDTDTNYQLNIEDAYELNKYDIVIFADASIEAIDHFLFEEIKPKIEVNFSMHAISPQFVLGVCKEMYNTTPLTYLLHIKGKEWEFMEEPTKTAIENLDTSYTFITHKIQELNCQ